LGGEACRFYLGGEPGEEFSPGAETNVVLTARHHVTGHMTPKWSGCDSQHSPYRLIHSAIELLKPISIKLVDVSRWLGSCRLTVVGVDWLRGSCQSVVGLNYDEQSQILKLINSLSLSLDSGAGDGVASRRWSMSLDGQRAGQRLSVSYDGRAKKGIASRQLSVSIELRRDSGQSILDSFERKTALW
jgi:hypothetical protein